MEDFSACNPYQLAPVIMTIATNSTCADRVVITIYQFCLQASIHVGYILSFFSKEKGWFPYLLEHTLHYTSSFSMLIHHNTAAVFLCTVHHQNTSGNFPLHGPLIFSPTDSHTRGSYTGTIPVPNLKGVSSMCTLTCLIGSIQSLVLEIHPTQISEIYPPQQS